MGVCGDYSPIIIEVTVSRCDNEWVIPFSNQLFSV